MALAIPEIAGFELFAQWPARMGYIGSFGLHQSRTPGERSVVCVN